MSRKAFVTKNVKPLLVQASALRPLDRLDLVNALLEDLDRPDSHVEQAWIPEAKRRLAAMRSGLMRTYSLGQVFGQYRMQSPR